MCAFVSLLCAVCLRAGVFDACLPGFVLAERCSVLCARCVRRVLCCAWSVCCLAVMCVWYALRVARAVCVAAR